MYYEKTNIFSVIKEAVFSMRTGDYGAAASQINRLLLLLQAEISKGTIAARDLSKLTYSLETLAAFQKSGDWVAVADILEFEFEALWKSAVNQSSS